MNTMAALTTREASIHSVTAAVHLNLRDQHDWTSLDVLGPDRGHARPLIRGLPPKLLYLHPDDQIAALAAPIPVSISGSGSGPSSESQPQPQPQPVTAAAAATAAGQPYRAPELEWVLPVHPAETWSLAHFAAVFASLPADKPRGKRIVLAMLHNDSTVVYYLMHEGMVKPRQN